MQRRKYRGVRGVFKRVWAAAKGRRTSEHSTDYQNLEDVSGGLDAEYRRMVASHLDRLGVPPACAVVEVEQLEDERGKQAFVATICVVAWDRNAVLRVLLGLPLLDKKVRKAAEVSWAADVSVFKGVQLRVTEALHASRATSELRHLVVSLTTAEGAQRDPNSEAAALVD
jgi:hypothetical protein